LNNLNFNDVYLSLGRVLKIPNTPKTKIVHTSCCVNLCLMNCHEEYLPIGITGNCIFYKRNDQRYWCTL